MAIITVGQGQQFSTISGAVAASSEGDTIQVQAGTYTNDFPVVSKKVTLEGVGGIVHLLATVAPPNGKAIMVTQTDVTIYNFEFSGAAVADGNGAGIRYEGGNLVLDHTYFHDNQDGLLGNAAPTGSITILSSEFAHNGAGDGFTHNLYVGAIDTLTVRNSYLHDAVVGHEIKSRAAHNIIENNRITSGPSGTGSYLIDLANGGTASIQNNALEKGPNASNPVFVTFGEEGSLYANPSLTVANNVAINDYNAHIPLFVRAPVAATVSVTGNQLYNLTSAQVYSGTSPDTESGNTFLTTRPTLDTSSPYQPPVSFSLACFAEGTLIQTEHGAVAVEILRAGERIVTVLDGVSVLRPVRWIGHRLVRPDRHPRPETVRPVRVARDAFAPGVPRRALSLSPDHAVYVDGVLIAVRRLINGTTIRQDETCGPIRYFHVECDTHTVLLAEGLAAETYLDTGNRQAFVDGAAALAAHPDFAASTQKGAHGRETLSCAPFVVEEAAVLPVWRRLAHRAAALGYERRARPTTTDPAPRLRAGNRWIAPFPTRERDTTEGCHVFALPAGLTHVRLTTRASSPTDTRPWLEDRRTLGVLVSRVVLRAGREVREIPLDHPSLTRGWWGVERDGTGLQRWTNGDALIPLPRLPTAATLELHFGSGMTYPVEAGDTGASAKAWPSAGALVQSPDASTDTALVASADAFLAA